MKLLLSLLPQLLVATAASAQAFSPNIIATAGTTGGNGQQQLSYTVGEMTSVFTATAGGAALTQGFQQPEHLTATGLVRLFPPQPVQLSVHPNPANSSCTVTVRMAATGNLNISICDVLGHVVAQVSNDLVASGSHEQTVALSTLPAGSYYVKAQIAAPDGNQSVLTAPVSIIH